MNKIFASVALLAGIVGMGQAQTSTFTSFELGLAFDYPSTWKLEKKKFSSDFSIPLEGQASAGILQIFSAIARDEPAQWELLLKTQNTQMRREVVRQWQEEILGVPLLLTKAEYDKAGVRMTALTGLMYSSAPRKLHFLLDVPADAFEGADFALRQAFQTLRTVKGTMPIAEDPSKPVDPVVYTKPVESKPLKVTRIGPEPKPIKAPVRGSVSFDLTVSARAAKLFLPEGWTAEPAPNGVTLRNAALSGPILLSTFTTLDSPPAISSLFRASAVSLALYQTVAVRREQSMQSSRAGSTTSAIWREGNGANGPMQSVDAVGAIGDFYWLFGFRHEGILSPEAKAAIDQLVDGMSLEPAG